MFKHKTDEIVDYRIRINTEGIASFISTKSWVDVKDVCAKPQAVFLPQWLPPSGSMISRILEFEKATNFQILDPRWVKHPKARQLKFRRGVKMFPDNNDFIVWYDGDSVSFDPPVVWSC